MKPSFLRSLALAVVAGGTLLASTTPQVQAAPAYLNTGLTLSAQLRAKGEAGVFTNASGVNLNRYGGNWSGSDISFYSLQGNANDGLPMNYTKCAPLISRLLKNVHNFRWNTWSFWDDVQNKTNQTASPYPYQMIQMMEQGKGFSTSFTDLDLAQPGDIVCLSRNDDPTDDHAMLLVEVLADDAVDYPSDAANADAAYDGAVFVQIRVLDSTSTNPNSANGGLHSGDTRRFDYPNGTVRFTPGIGTGLMGVLVSATGEILGHTWSLPTDGNPESEDADEVEAWVEDLHDRLETQTGATGRVMVIGRPSV